MAENRRNVLSLLKRSSLGSAVLMTLIAVFVAGLLPLKVQARSPQARTPADASLVSRVPDATMNATHERNW
jgi:hypothetical protein